MLSLGGISFFSFSISEKSIEQFKDVGFILLIEQLNILQAPECFGVNLHTGLTDEIVERYFQGVSDLTGDLNGRFNLIAFILTNDIPGRADVFAQLSLGEVFAFAQGDYLFSKSHIYRLKGRYTKPFAKVDDISVGIKSD